MHVAALHQGGLAWPCPAWLQPTAPGKQSQHHTGAQTHPKQADTSASSSGSSAATPSNSDAQQQSGSGSSSGSSSDDDSSTCLANSAATASAPADKAATATHRATANAINTRTKKSWDGVSISQASENGSEDEDGDDTSSDSDSESPGSSEGDSDSDSMNAQDNNAHRTDPQMPVQGSGARQQSAFDLLDALFARTGASGSMSTQLAALDLLKKKPGHSVHSAPQLAGRKSQDGRLLKAPRELQGGKSGANAGRGLGQQRLLAGECGEKTTPKAEWVQMQNGGNPLYSNQKAGSASPGEW